MQIAQIIYLCHKQGWCKRQNNGRRFQSAACWSKLGGVVCCGFERWVRRHSTTTAEEVGKPWMLLVPLHLQLDPPIPTFCLTMSVSGHCIVLCLDTLSGAYCKCHGTHCGCWVKWRKLPCTTIVASWPPHPTMHWEVAMMYTKPKSADPSDTCLFCRASHNVPQV